MCLDGPRRNPVFCILPPHMLRALARNGSAAERDIALATLATDQTARMNRAFRGGPACLYSETGSVNWLGEH